VTGDTNGSVDVFLRDLQSAQTVRISVNSVGGQANGDSVGGQISADGRMVAFRSLATDLVAGDFNDPQDVFVHDRSTGVTKVLSVEPGGGEANNQSDMAVVSADGAWVAFRSYASDLVVGDTNAASDVFVSSMLIHCYRAMQRTRRQLRRHDRRRLPQYVLHRWHDRPRLRASDRGHRCAELHGFVRLRRCRESSRGPTLRHDGTIFYGFYPTAVPWAPASPSFKCVANPVQRLGVQDSGGTAGQCDGELRIDFNAWLQAHPGALGSPFVAGQVFYAQGWFRDPGAPKGTNLSDGLKFTLCN
jgi:hypothetical protein